MKNRNFQDSLRTSTSQISIRFHDQDDIRDPPEKIRQNKFTKTYSKLQYIPLQKHIETLNPKNIEHLYISHNKIKSLSGIQEFQNLLSLNVSYNLLTKIQELEFIQKPQNIVRIGLKMNDFIYGYQDYAVNFFKNLQRLDDINVKDKIRVKKLQQKGNTVANSFLQFHIRTSRIFIFLDDLIKQQKLHEQMKLKKSQKRKINPKLKLLFEHMTQKFIVKVSQAFVMPTQEQFLHLPSIEILNKIERVIDTTLKEDIDLKCTCRPRIPYQEQVKNSFKQICSQFLSKFQGRYNYELKNGLDKIDRKFNTKIRCRKLQKWELWGMLQNYSTLSLGGKTYQNITSTIGKNYVQLKDQNQNHIPSQIRKPKQTQNQWRNKLFLSQNNSQFDKQNLSPNIQTKSQQNQNFNKNKKQKQDFQLFYDRIPIVLYQKNYVQVLLQITMDIIKRLLQKYDYLCKARTKYLESVEKQKSKQKRFLSLDQIYVIVQQNKHQNQRQKAQNVQNYSKKQKISKLQNHSNKEKAKSSFQQIKNMKIGEIVKQDLLKDTVAQNSPSHHNDQLFEDKITERKFLKRQQSQISFGISKETDYNIQFQQRLKVTKKNKSHKNYKKDKSHKNNNKDYSAYEINLIYKVFRALKMRVIRQKSKKKHQLSYQ